MKKVMLLAAVVAMVMAAAVPALAQTVTQGGNGNINVACVQNAVQQNVVDQGGNAQANQYGGDNIIANTNINAQAIAQECNIAVAQVNTVVKDYYNKDYYNKDYNKDYYNKDYYNKDYYNKDYASAPAAKYQYKYYEKNYASAPAAQYEYKYYEKNYASAPAAQYEYATASASASAAPAAELPDTGGSSLIALGAGVLLVAGGLLARRIVR